MDMILIAVYVNNNLLIDGLSYRNYNSRVFLEFFADFPNFLAVFVNFERPVMAMFFLLNLFVG
jgi:hypothetical protein